MSPQDADFPQTLSLPEKVSLVAEVLASYRTARRGLRRTQLREILAEERDARLAAHGALARHLPHGEARALGRAVTRTLRTLPTDSRCLTQSVVASILLARRGAPSRLVIAVRPGGEFRAHAWVEYAGRPILPAHRREFERLLEL